MKKGLIENMNLPDFIRTPKFPGDKKLEKLNFVIRFSVLIGVMLVFGFIGVATLMKIQIVDGAYYSAQTQRSFTANQSIQAARGQVTDSEGRLLNGNQTVYKVIIQRAFFPFGEENEVISRTLSILAEHGEEWHDSVPITMAAPFEFLNVKESELESFKRSIGVNIDASVENCIKAIFENYNISGDYDAEAGRAVAGVRYEMRLRDFSFANRFTLAEDISFETLVALKERGMGLPGVDIIEEPMRIYLSGDVMAHTRGAIGRISAEEFAELREHGYSLNDTIGKTGIEFSMESILRGENGTRTIVRNMQGVAVSDEINVSARPGNSVRLTIDSRFQADLQEMLQNHIYWLRTLDQTYKNETFNWRGLNSEGGAVAVIEVKTGRVLGLANYPTYDINDYVTNYEAVLNAELTPLLNRATSGLYRPGSSFKPITSVAGLYNNIVARNTTVACGGTYTFFPDYHPHCHNRGGHGGVNVINALRLSCNIYYYDIGRRMGIDALVETTNALGIGVNLGLETGGPAGRMTTPEIYEQLLGFPLTAGDTIQAAIGQSETLITPLHLAVAAATIANHGVRYRPYLVDSVWNYDFTELIYKTEPQIANIFGADRDDVWTATHDGMVSVSDFITWPVGVSSQFAYLPSVAAVKTGTPQAANDTYNSVIMGYYPEDDPEIAFAVVIENSEFSRNLVRNIIDSYFYDAYEPDIDENGIIISPWKRWDDEKAARIMGG
ncbi:MAG: penicillin-binding transpeptidase domain-containing protein [Oscillospiraceae bacterium]|nr:penicillin-binding transpeptidase domain-containing protein [Oscillospiraceae bacterium]